MDTTRTAGSVARRVSSMLSAGVNGGSFGRLGVDTIIPEPGPAVIPEPGPQGWILLSV